jgi:hypothetical protein
VSPRGPALVLSALAFALAFAPAAASAEVRLDVRAEPTVLALHDRLTLQVSVQTRGMGSPDIELPELEGFEIVSRQVQRPMQFSFSFGAQATVQSSTIYTFVLQPLREGRIVIKPVRVSLDGKVESSQPIAISVAGSGQAPPGAAPPGAAPGAAAPNASVSPPGTPMALDAVEVDAAAFVRATADKAQPYEGEQTTVNIYLYARDRLQSNPSIETEPTTDGLWVHDLLSPQRALQPERQIVNGQVYTVYLLRRIAAFPLHAGEVTIGPMAIELDTSSLFDIFSPQRARSKLRRNGLPLTLRVRPLPEAGKPKGEVAVGRFTLTTKLDRTQAVTGDAVTLTAVVEGHGNIRTIDLELPAVPGLDVLQPEIKDLVTAPNDLVGGTREYRWLLVARKPGRFAIPPLVLATFDPASERYEQVKSAPLVLDVVGQAMAAAQPGARDAAGSDPQLPPDTADDAGAEHVWAPIRTQSELRRGYARLAERPFYGWLLCAPLLIWLAAVCTGALRRHASTRARSGPGRGLRQAEQRLHAAESAAHGAEPARFHAEASAALTSVLEARLTEPVAGYTRRELEQRLIDRGMAAGLAAELIQALERSDFARFSAAASEGDLRAQADALRELFRKLAAFTPTAQERA